MVSQVINTISKRQMFGALRYREFRKYFYSTIWQSSGLGMQFLIIGWIVLELTDSSSQLGLVIFLYGVPNLALLPLAGIAADRMDRRLLLIVSRTVVGLVIAVLATLTTMNLVPMWHLYLAAMILGGIQGFNMPAGMALVADLVKRDDMLNATSLNSAVMNGIHILVPSLAGITMETVGIGEALYLNSACFGMSVLHLWTMRKIPSHDSAAETNVLGNLRDGIKFILRTPVVFGIIGMGFAFGFFGAAYLRVIPAFAKDILSLDAVGAGLLLSAAGAGSLLGNMALASLGNSQHKNWLLLGTIALFGISLLFLAWSSWYPVSLAVMFFVGMGFGGFISMMITVLQLSTPPDMRGRIMSMMLISAALHYVGALPLSIVADLFGWPIAITGGASLMLAVVVWLGLLSPTIRQMQVK